MSVWTVQPVDEQPELTLRAWRVYETDTQARHLVGWCIENREGRVSTAVESFDPVTARVVTRSGRVYELAGRPGANLDAEYTWNRWKALNGVASATDVTLAVWAEIQAAHSGTPGGEGA